MKSLSLFVAVLVLCTTGVSYVAAEEKASDPVVKAFETGWTAVIGLDDSGLEKKEAKVNWEFAKVSEKAKDGSYGVEVKFAEDPKGKKGLKGEIKGSFKDGILEAKSPSGRMQVRLVFELAKDGVPTGRAIGYWKSPSDKLGIRIENATLLKAAKKLPADKELAKFLSKGRKLTLSIDVGGQLLGNPFGNRNRPGELEIVKAKDGAIEGTFTFTRGGGAKEEGSFEGKIEGRRLILKRLKVGGAEKPADWKAFKDEPDEEAILIFTRDGKKWTSEGWWNHRQKGFLIDSNFYLRPWTWSEKE